MTELTFKQNLVLVFSDNLLKILCFFLRGVNVVPFLELIGLPDSIVNILKNSQSGNALTAYALFKVGTIINRLLLTLKK